MATYGIGFPPVAIGVHFLGLVSLALMLAWVIAYRGGVSLFTSNSTQIFNAHPVIQIGGFIFIYAEAILVYKTLNGPKKTKKLVHLILQAIAFLFLLLGVWAAYKFHIDLGIDNFYSFHSWLGIATVILFFVQWIAGFVSFWTQSVGPSTRAAYLPWHVFLGLFIFVLAIVTALTGIFEKITFLQKDGALGHYDTEAMFVNSSALVVLVFGAVVVFAAIMPAPKDEDGYQPIS